MASDIHRVWAGDRHVRRQTFMVLTPANRYESKLPSLPHASVFKLVTPRWPGARFGQYLLGFPGPSSGELADASHEHFVYVLSGRLTLSCGGHHWQIAEGSSAYIPAGEGCHVECEAATSVLWIKRPYQPWRGLQPPLAEVSYFADRTMVPTTTPGLLRCELLDPAKPAHDFNMSLLEFAPDAGLTQVEVHDEEHGLYMMSGSGAYYLDGEIRDVRAGDFVYMAPYCPQGFAAGPQGAQYLLYKDAFRDGFGALAEPLDGIVDL